MTLDFQTALHLGLFCLTFYLLYLVLTQDIF